MWEEQVRCIVGKELDDICTSCPYIDAIKRHKQQLGAIEEYTQWLKKEPRASYFFLFRLYTRIHNTFFPKKQQLPFTPGGTHCPEPDVTLRDLTLSPGYHSDYAPQPIPEMDSSAVVPPTNENTSPPEDTPDNTPAGGNTGQAEKTRNSGLTPIPEKRSGMPPEHLRFATGFPPQPKIAGPKGKPMRTVHPDKIYREIIWFCSGYLRKSGPEATRTIINSIFCEWASIFNDYSSPFSWVDSRDSEQCDWL
ncbi:hypothetical protein HEM02_024745, partial [Escherichia coli]|nr:hypothetical protein [Escherichia coli]MBB7777849.1 hypothetical protein [Escherichia coli]MBC0954274.1 hypothetical protein [Escherichia coli]